MLQSTTLLVLITCNCSFVLPEGILTNCEYMVKENVKWEESGNADLAYH